MRKVFSNQLIRWLTIIAAVLAICWLVLWLRARAANQESKSADYHAARQMSPSFFSAVKPPAPPTPPPPPQVQTPPPPMFYAADYAPCPVCSGTGKVTCPVCGGTGFLPSQAGFYNPRTGDVWRFGVACDFCGGDGKVLCTNCLGIGKVVVKTPSSQPYVAPGIHQCPDCGGMGRVFDYAAGNYKSCWRCWGTGYTYR